MAINKKSVGSIFNNAGFFRLRDANRESGADPGKASDIEMHPMGAQAPNPGTTPAPDPHQEQNARPEPDPQPNNPPKPPFIYKWRPLFTLSLGFLILFISVALLSTYKASKADFKDRWSREGSPEKLTPGQVIYASVPKRLIWARFLLFLWPQVWILVAVDGYASITASSTCRVAKVMRKAQLGFFVVALIALSALMYGWLLFFI